MSISSCKSSFVSWAAAALCVGTAFIAAGCGDDVEGPPIGAVAGEVKFEGKPVAAGQVHFADDEAGRMFTGNITNGQYSLNSQFGNGVPLASYKVKITPPPPAPVANPTSAAQVAPVPEAPDIPEKYRDFSTSGLTAEVKEGSNPLDFDMKP